MDEQHAIPPDLAARLLLLERQVAHLFAELGLTPPGWDEVRADALGPAARERLAAGDREGAVRAVMREEGVSQATAIARVDAVAHGRP